MNNDKRKFNPWIRLVLAIFVQFLVYIPSILLSVILPESSFNSFAIYEGARLTVPLTGLLLVYLLMSYVDRRSLSFLRLKLDKNAGIGFLLSLLITGLIVLCVRWLGTLIIPDGQLDFHKFDFSGKWLLSVIVGGFFMQGFTEELIFRAYLPQTLEMKAIPTLWLSSLAFTAIHLHYIGSTSLIGLIIELFYPFAFGVLAFVLVYLLQTSWAAVAVHGGIHFFREVGDILGLWDSSGLLFVTSITMIVLSLILVHFNRQDFEAGHIS